MGANGWTPVEDTGAWTPVQEKPEHEQPGFWQRTYENSGLQGIVSKVKELANDPDKLESLPYDLVAGAAQAQYGQGKQAVQSAKAGNASETIGHGVAAITPFVGPMAAETGGKLGTDIGGVNYRGAAGDVAGFGSAMLAPKVVADMAPATLAALESEGVAAAVKAAAKELPKAAIKRIPYAGKVASDVVEAAIKAKKAAEFPAIEPDATSPKQNYAGENFGPMDKPGGAPDATNQNKAYAGEDMGKLLQMPPAEALRKPPISVGTQAGADLDTALYKQAEAELPNGSLSEKLQRAQELKIKGAVGGNGIPGKSTVEPSPSSEAYKQAPAPEGTVVPTGDNLTDLLKRSVEKVKAPAYDSETIAQAAEGLAKQGYDPSAIRQVLAKMGLQHPEGMDIAAQVKENPPSWIPQHPGEGPMNQAKFQQTLNEVGRLSDEAEKWAKKAKGAGKLKPLPPTDEDFQALLDKYAPKH